VRQHHRWLLSLRIGIDATATHCCRSHTLLLALRRCACSSRIPHLAVTP
jgi:hypothetical protein